MDGGALSLSRQAIRHASTLADRGADVTEVDSRVAACMLDFLSGCLTARATPWAPTLLRHDRMRAGPGRAFHFGLQRKGASDTAAFGNAVLGHGLIREDVHLGSGSHIGGIVIPAMLALAERDGLSGQDLIRGIVAGYEAAARPGAAAAEDRASFLGAPK